MDGKNHIYWILTTSTINKEHIMWYVPNDVDTLKFIALNALLPNKPFCEYNSFD
jgi:hypothetical protein